MMFTRLALDDEEDACVEMARAHYAESWPDVEFDEERSRATFQLYLATAVPTIFVVEERRELIGFMLAVTHGYASRRGHFVTQEVIYVKPDKRGSRAAAMLIQAYNQWADRSGAEEAYRKIPIKPGKAKQRGFGYKEISINLRRTRGDT